MTLGETGAAQCNCAVCCIGRPLDYFYPSNHLSTAKDEYRYKKELVFTFYMIRVCVCETNHRAEHKKREETHDHEVSSTKLTDELVTFSIFCMLIANNCKLVFTI